MEFQKKSKSEKWPFFRQTLQKAGLAETYYTQKSLLRVVFQIHLISGSHRHSVEIFRPLPF